MKIAYFGLPLGALLLARDGHELALVVLSPLAAPGRRRLRRKAPASLVLDALSPGSTLDARIAQALVDCQPDLLISWFWTRKLPQAWLASARLGAIGAHPSLLPRHRGPNPYFWSIDSGDELAGVTVHRLSAEYDTGAMLGQRTMALGERNAWQLARALDRPALGLLREIAGRFAELSRVDAATAKSLPETEQVEALASWAPEPTGEELRVDFGWGTERVLRRIRALSPTPGLALEVAGVKLFVTRAEATGSYLQALLPGEAQIGEALLLRTGDGAVRVTGALFPSSAGDENDVSDDDGDPANSASDVVALLKRGGRP